MGGCQNSIPKFSVLAIKQTLSLKQIVPGEFIVMIYCVRPKLPIKKHHHKTVLKVFTFVLFSFFSMHCYASRSATGTHCCHTSRFVSGLGSWDTCMLVCFDLLHQRHSAATKRGDPFLQGGDALHCSRMERQTPGVFCSVNTSAKCQTWMFSFWACPRFWMQPCVYSGLDCGSESVDSQLHVNKHHETATCG